MSANSVCILREEGANLTKTRIIAELGRHIRTDPSKLAKYCYKPLGSVSEDVATVVEAVALADRLIPRRRSGGWARAISLSVPVFNPSVFQEGKNAEALLEAMSFLTGDAWAVEFSQRTDRPLQEEYLPLVQSAPKHVVPYSNGLDSFAQARLLERAFGKSNVLRVRAGILEETDSRIGVPILRVRRGFKMGRVREQSYRTRPLVFYSFAAIAAVTAEAESVVIGESGQGSLGPSFAIYADEWPLRSSHPGFLHRLQTFLSLVLNKKVKFDQPQLWRTKGQVLTELREQNLHVGWAKTRSCSLRPRERRGMRSCGFCGGCLLRRVSASVAGLEGDDAYAFDPQSHDLILATNHGQNVDMTLNDRQILARSSGSMAIVASVLNQPDADEIIARELMDIPSELHSDAQSDMKSFLGRHSLEWTEYLAGLRQTSWLRQRYLEHA